MWRDESLMYICWRKENSRKNSISTKEPLRGLKTDDDIQNVQTDSVLFKWAENNGKKMTERKEKWI